MAAFWWAFTLAASLAQTLRNAMQRELIGVLGPVGAAQVRFLFGLPFALSFLVGIVIFTGEALPRLTLATALWTGLGAAAQIAATALMLAAMRTKSFVVVIAATKTEAAQVALFALVALGERPTPGLLAAIALATGGVWLMSGVRRGFGEGGALTLGLVSASFFAVSAIAFRAGVIGVVGGSFVIRASFVLTLGLALQTALLFVYLRFFDAKAIAPILRAWRPSLLAGFMGALASQFWFIALALSEAAPVRTLALIEAPLAMVVSLKVFKERLAAMEAAGVALIVVAAGLLVSGVAR